MLLAQPFDCGGAGESHVVFSGLVRAILLAVTGIVVQRGGLPWRNLIQFWRMTVCTGAHQLLIVGP